MGLVHINHIYNMCTDKGSCSMCNALEHLPLSSRHFEAKHEWQFFDKPEIGI